MCAQLVENLQATNCLQISSGFGLSVDYLSSSVGRTELPTPLELGDSSHPVAGDVVACLVQEVNAAYPLLELFDGAELSLSRGKVILGVLGVRKALHGFSGRVPKQLKRGQRLYLLNKGGVIGDCTAFHRDLEWPSQVEYLGTVRRDGTTVNIGDSALNFIRAPLPRIPLIAVLGTCMNSGKTTVCKRIIEGLVETGKPVNAGKVAGVACRHDVLEMAKSGAGKTLSFHDFGLPSSAEIDSLIPVARSMIHHLAVSQTDCLVLEMGDGILGGYQVSTLFADKEFLGIRACTVICANDLMGVWGALEWMDRNGAGSGNCPTLVSGPVTDSAEGVEYIERNFGVAAANPFDSPGKLLSFVHESLLSC